MNYLNTFPANTNTSYYSYSSSAWVLIMNTTNNTRIISELVGDGYDVDVTSIACSAKHQVAYVVSTSGYGNPPAKKRSRNNYDVRITTIDINTGNRFYK